MAHFTGTDPSRDYNFNGSQYTQQSQSAWPDPQVNRHISSLGPDACERSTSPDEHALPPVSSMFNINTTPSHRPPDNNRNIRPTQSRRFIISPAVVDGLAKDYGLADQPRGNLHLLAETCSDPESDMAKAHIYVSLLLSAQISECNQRLLRLERQANGESSALAGVLHELKTRLEGSFDFTNEQRTNVRAVCGDALYEATRTNFKNVHVDIFEVLSKEREQLGLTNVFGNPSREAKLLALTKESATSVRSRFRRELHQSIRPQSFVSLDQFTYSSGTKYLRLGPNKVKNLADPSFKFHNVLLRHFAHLNPSDDDDEDHQGDDDMSSPDGSRKRRKRAGRVGSGDDYWSRMDVWFDQLVKERGPDLRNHEWRRYLNNLVQLDDNRFVAAVPLTSSSGPEAGYNRSSHRAGWD